MNNSRTINKWKAEFLVKICVVGAINWDINLFVERFPEIGEEVPVEKISRVPGGKLRTWQSPQPESWVQTRWLLSVAWEETPLQTNK